MLYNLIICDKKIRTNKTEIIFFITYIITSLIKNRTCVAIMTFYIFSSSNSSLMNELFSVIIFYTI